jgi:hypothetical protein
MANPIFPLRRHARAEGNHADETRADHVLQIPALCQDVLPLRTLRRRMGLRAQGHLRMKEITIPTRAVNLRTEPFDVYIGRGSQWGNPYSHLAGTKAKIAVASREDAIEAYEEWLQEPAQARLRRQIPTLKGKRLGCYCKPQSCHGDILARLADAS